jgi:putative transposase
MIQEVEELAEEVGISLACQVLGVPRSSFYYAQKSRKPSPPASHPRALSIDEKEKVRSKLNSERFQDQAPRAVYAALLDDGIYLCHWRTMYSILNENDEVRERRDQLRHPDYKKPELLATEPNQVWSWDITKLLGPQKWTYYYLYVILDIYSRYVTGWMITDQQTAALAQELIEQTCEKQGVQEDQLTLHADRGGPMIAKSLALLLADLGVSKSHSRPYNSNDNPYSESQFKTMKYRPDYPDRFGSQPDARVWARSFFEWYNYEHYHSALGLMVPADVHYGRAETILQKRQNVLQSAYEKHPERFVNGPPSPPEVPEAVWINPPKKKGEKENVAVVAEAVELGGKSEHGGDLSPNPQPPKT